MDKNQIEQAEVQKAIADFIAGGGIAIHLPDEKTPILNLVGRKFGQFEDLFVSDLAGPEFY